MPASGGVAVGLGILGTLLVFAFGKKKKKTGPGGGVVGKGYPWGVYSEDTRQLQAEINAVLSEHGLATISEDGKLGGETCGAAQYVADQYGIGVVPSTCKDFTWVPTAAGGKTWNQWNDEIETRRNVALSTFEQSARADSDRIKLINAATALRNLNIPFPDLKQKANVYAQQLQDVANGS